VSISASSVLEQAVAAALAGGEVGLQVAVVIDGRPVVDIAAGHADRALGTPVTSGSLFPLFSATKAVVAAACTQALEDGRLRIDEPLVSLWPELCPGERSTLTLRHLLTHAAGLPFMPVGTTVEMMCDWSAMVRALEQSPSAWAPGQQVGYHAYTYGWLVGEVLSRGYGRPDVGALIRELVVTPAGVDDVWIGIPAAIEHRVVTLERGAQRERPDDSLFRRTIPLSLDTGPEVYGRSDVRQACLPGAGGIGSALAVAHVYSRLAHLARGDGWFAEAARLCEERTDVVLEVAVPRGLGYYVSGAGPGSLAAGFAPPFGPAPGRFGHPGAGGTIAWADIELGAGFAIARNWMTGLGWNDPPIQALIAAAYEAAGGHA
jgi:CubicO group peptidase (beta-lactamase class C family)